MAKSKFAHTQNMDFKKSPSTVTKPGVTPPFKGQKMAPTHPAKVGLAPKKGK